MTAPSEPRCARCGQTESDPDPINGHIHPPDHAFVPSRETELTEQQLEALAQETYEMFQMLWQAKP